jgi:hypothetical protein
MGDAPAVVHHSITALTTMSTTSRPTMPRDGPSLAPLIRPSLADLEPEFRARCERLLARCRPRGVEMRVNETVRDPLRQARLWRQSRTRETIAATIDDLRARGAPFLAHCVESVGPQSGPEVTRALPGLSWHQWGEALDCFWVVDGAAVWSTTRRVNGVNGFRVYAEEARALGLTAGGFFTRFRDFPHVQLRAAASPAAVFSLAEVDAVMVERFG